MHLFNNTKGTNMITVNGKTITVQGNNVSVSGDGTVKVDGKIVESGLSGEVTIKFEGDLANLRTDGSATINGNVQGDAISGGSMSTGDVGNNAQSGAQ